MRRYWSFLMLHFLGMAMAFAFLCQLKLHGGAMFAIQWWPVPITGILLGAACCLQAPPNKERRGLRLRRAIPRLLMPNDFTLKISALISFGLSPVWGWRNSAASLSHGLLDYFSLQLMVASLAMFYMVVAFLFLMREFARSIGVANRLAHGCTFVLRCWLYFVFVPIVASIIGSGRMWQEIASQPDLNWHQLVQLVQFQSMVVFYSWIGEALKVVVLFLLAADVCFSFALLFVYNDFLNQKNVDGLTEETAVPIGPSSEDNPNETQGNDT